MTTADVLAPGVDMRCSVLMLALSGNRVSGTTETVASVGKFLETGMLAADGP